MYLSVSLRHQFSVKRKFIVSKTNSSCFSKIISSKSVIHHHSQKWRNEKNCAGNLKCQIPMLANSGLWLTIKACTSYWWLNGLELSPSISVSLDDTAYMSLSIRQHKWHSQHQPYPILPNLLSQSKWATGLFFIPHLSDEEISPANFIGKAINATIEGTAGTIPKTQSSYGCNRSIYHLHIWY